MDLDPEVYDEGYEVYIPLLPRHILEHPLMKYVPFLPRLKKDTKDNPEISENHENKMC